MSAQETALHKRCEQLEAENNALRVQLQGLATRLFLKHYAKVEPYVSGSFQWSPQAEIPGLIQQLEALTEGLESLPDEIRKDAMRLHTLLTAIEHHSENTEFMRVFAEAVEGFQSTNKTSASKFAIDHAVASVGMPKVSK